MVVVIAATIRLLLEVTAVVKVRKYLLPKHGSFRKYQAKTLLRNDMRLLSKSNKSYRLRSELSKHARHSLWPSCYWRRAMRSAFLLH